MSTDQICRWFLAACWLWQGLVPKLLFPEGGELALLRQSHLVPDEFAPVALMVIGAGEVAFGLLLLTGWQRRWLYYANAAAVIALGLGGLITQPALVQAPFNPLTLGLPMLGLSIAGLRS